MYPVAPSITVPTNLEELRRQLATAVGVVAQRAVPVSLKKLYARQGDIVYGPNFRKPPVPRFEETI